MKCRSDGSTQQTSSLKAGFSVRSGRGLENGGRTVAEKGLRAWKTRKNPFTAIFESEIEPCLIADTSRSATMILEHLQDKLGSQAYPNSLQRTLQRIVHNWKIFHGPAKRAIFLQTHPPGEPSLSRKIALKCNSSENQA